MYTSGNHNRLYVRGINYCIEAKIMDFYVSIILITMIGLFIWWSFLIISGRKDQPSHGNKWSWTL